MRSSRLACLAAVVSIACSPEADRVRDGGPGADPGNKVLVDSTAANPQTRDTTLWPGRAPTPVERLSRGEILPAAGVASTTAAGAQGKAPVTPNVPPSAADQRTFDKATSGDARRPQSARPRPPR